MANSLLDITDAQLGLGRRREAGRALTKCLRLAQETQFLEVSALAFDRAAALLLDSGDTETAARLAGAADALFEHVDFLHPPEQHHSDAVLAGAREAVPESADRLHDEGQLLTVDEASALALAKLSTSAEPEPS